MTAIWTKLRLPKVSYVLRKSDNPLKAASAANFIYIHNLSVYFAKCFYHVWLAYAIGWQIN